MAKYLISEGKPLQGRVRISGSKNSVLPLIAGSLLTEEVCTIEDVPDLCDVKVMCELGDALGCKHMYDLKKSSLIIDAKKMDGVTAPYELVNKMRASFLVMGPLLARFGIARIPLPGGCAIGTRPVDLHLKGFAAMGAEVNQEHGYVEVKVNNKLQGTKIYLDFPSVGATENLMMAAALASGTTTIENAATEPEIVDLATFLTRMGADIKAAGTDSIRITGVNYLKGASHTVIPDRIEAGTYMVAGAITGGNIVIENLVTDHLKPIIAKLKEIGVEIYEEGSSLRVISGRELRSVDVKTLPYPGFPTDMQAQIASLLSICQGTGVVIETIFENRFMHFNELARMGANVKIEGRSAIIEGVEHLTGAKVKATDLRAGAALILAGLVAKGETEISNVAYIDRGYEKAVEKFSALGANIKRLEE